MSKTSLLQTCENLGSIGHRSCKRIVKEKHTCCKGLFAFHMQRLQPEVFYFFVRNYIFLYFRGSRFLQCFKLSKNLQWSLLSKLFMLTIILSKYQQCSVPLKVTVNQQVKYLSYFGIFISTFIGLKQPSNKLFGFYCTLISETAALLRMPNWTLLKG